MTVVAARTFVVERQRGRGVVNVAQKMKKDEQLGTIAKNDALSRELFERESPLNDGNYLN